MAKPHGDFENKSRLLSDDEKELVRVLDSFHGAITDLRERQKALEDQQKALVAVMGISMVQERKKDD